MTMTERAAKRIRHDLKFRLLQVRRVSRITPKMVRMTLGGEDLPGVVEDAIAARAPAVWFQLGCVNDSAAASAQAAGITVVMDRCMEVESLRLLGQYWRRT